MVADEPPSPTGGPNDLKPTWPEERIAHPAPGAEEATAWKVDTGREVRDGSPAQPMPSVASGALPQARPDPPVRTGPQPSVGRPVDPLPGVTPASAAASEEFGRWAAGAAVPVAVDPRVGRPPVATSGRTAGWVGAVGLALLLGACLLGVIATGGGLSFVLRGLAFAVGPIGVLMVVVGGILYATRGADRPRG